jgi:predicted house-cleaning NTP pyrophosphatase (Maf/HAM1 superfamily)
MLTAAGVPFESASAELDEDAAKAGLESAGFDPRAVAEELAQLKALSIAAEQDALVLGSDQTLERLDGTMLSKPATRDEALVQLRSLGGTTHYLHSAAVIAEGGEAIWWHSETVELTMRPLSDSSWRVISSANMRRSAGASADTASKRKECNCSSGSKGVISRSWACPCSRSWHICASGR